jgi:hypothetical protein
MAAYMWSTISTVLGVFSRPSCFTQYFWWIAKILPVGSNLHIVGIAALCWAIWKTRNNACFEGKLISSPLGLICYMCAFLRYWAGLQNEKDKELLLEGASRLQRGASVAHEVARTSRSSSARIQECDDDDIDQQSTWGEEKAPDVCPLSNGRCWSFWNLMLAAGCCWGYVPC